MGKIYVCKKCGFKYRFRIGVFTGIPSTVICELKKCPKCEVRMVVKK